VPRHIIWSWCTGRWWVGCYIWYSDEGTGRGRSPPRPLLAVPNVTAHPSTASVPITILLYNDPVLCGFNVAVKGLMFTSFTRSLRRRSRHRDSIFVKMTRNSLVDEIGERYRLNHAVVVQADCQAVVCGTMFLQAACLQNTPQLTS